MAEITVNGRIKVKSFYLSFNKAYPYLHAALVNKAGKSIDPDRTIANAREMEEYKPTKEVPVSVHGNLNVGTFEKRFKDNFGITCKVYTRKNDRWRGVTTAQRGMSLSELNASLKA